MATYWHLPDLFKDEVIELSGRDLTKTELAGATAEAESQNELGEVIFQMSRDK
jgi:hypothetical protein